MKKSCIAFAIAALMSVGAMAQDKIELPTPQFDEKSQKVTLVETLWKRQSERQYAETDLSLQELSNVLWAACGVNRPESKRITAPSAINAQDILVFVCRKDGAWKYDAFQNSLTRVSTLDLRKAVAGRQEFAAEAPVSLVLVSDVSRVHNNRELGDGCRLCFGKHLSRLHGHGTEDRCACHHGKRRPGARAGTD